MTFTRVFFIVMLAFSTSTASAQTVDQVIRRGSCTTAGVGGISRQLAETQMCLGSGSFVRFTPHANITLSSSSILPYLQGSARSALHAAAARTPIRINSAFRTLAQQYVLYHGGGCALVAAPGQSNHQSGRAIDVQNYSAARPALQAAGCTWLGSRDPWHFDCPGSDRRRDSVRAFQRLWNINNPGDRISEDGVYGPQTANRLGRSPANGFPRSGCSACTPSAETCNNNDDDCDGRTDEGLSRGCGTDVGRCERGTQTCRSGSWGSCQGGVSPRDERCDGVDDDCDGEVDGQSRSCGSDVGACVPGAELCTSGEWGECTGAIGPTRERCNTLDDNCDGMSDEGEVCEIEEIVHQLPTYGGSSDLDGDGRSDVCAYGDAELECHLAGDRDFERLFVGASTGDSTFEEPSEFSTLRLGDVDGDGRIDACMRVEEQLRCWLSDGEGFVSEVEGPSLLDEDGFDEASHFTTLRLADIDGDGRSDFCARWSEGLRCFRSTGDGFDEWALLEQLSDDAGFELASVYGTLRVGDVNGDGRDDVCARVPEGRMQCWLAGEDAFDELVLGPAWSEGFEERGHWSTIRLHDIDGDGAADLCARELGGYVCYPGRARGFGDPLLGPPLAGETWDTPEHYGTLRLGDIDGDGRSDLCARDVDGVHCWMLGTRGFATELLGPGLGDDAGWNVPERYRTLRLGDVDANGRADLCALDDEGVVCWLSLERPFVREVRGPRWSGDLWRLDQHFATIRLGGVASGEAVIGDAGVFEEEPGEPGGCQCAVGERRGSGALGSWVGLLLAGVLLRRRRR